MKIKHILLTIVLGIFATSLSAQTNVQHIDKLVLKKKKKHIFSDRDSSAIIYIDTLIMGDRSSLQFFGKNEVTLRVKHAEIGDRAFFLGQAGQNNASDFDIDIKFDQLGSLYIVARGRDALNGTKTHPNGDAGQVHLVYDPAGITPQTTDRDAKHYVKVDVSPGGQRVTPSADLNNIYDMIARAPRGLRGVPQGQIYSGSTGQEGTVTIESRE